MLSAVVCNVAGAWPALLEQLLSLLVLQQQQVQHAFMYIPQIRHLYPAFVCYLVRTHTQQQAGIYISLIVTTPMKTQDTSLDII